MDLASSRLSSMHSMPGLTALSTPPQVAEPAVQTRRCRSPRITSAWTCTRHTQVTKMLGELYTNMFQNLYDLPVVNARFFNSYGPGEVPGKYRNVIPNFFYWAMQERPLPITGTGEETRDFTYVGDIVNGLLACASTDEAVGEAINLATGREIRILDLANLVNEVTKNRAGIIFKERRNWDKKNRLVASIEKARRILHYEPKMDFRAGLKHVHRWFEKNWANIQKSAEF